MRVMITGATTPLGRALITDLLGQDECDYILAVGGEAGREDAFSDGRLHYTRVDLTRERSIRQLLFGTARDIGIDTIVDMATHRHTRAVGRRAHALNVESTRTLLRLAERVPTMRRFVYRSFGAVYAASTELPSIIDEDHPLNIGPNVSQWLLDRIEADLAVCARMGLSRLSIAVLRTAETLAPNTGSQLWDYLLSRVCFRPLGYDPMINVISEEDVGRALRHAATSEAQGIFTIPGMDTLPLSAVIHRFGRRDIPVPGPLMVPLYGMRRATVRKDFDWSLNRDRWHFSAVLDGKRAYRELGYEPQTPVHWPLQWKAIRDRAQRDNPRSLSRLLTRRLNAKASEAP